MKLNELLNQKSARFKKVFSTPEGVQVLADLKADLDSDSVFSTDPHTTAYNLGRRDAYIYIKQILRYGRNDGNVER